jgi:proline iminopeptidase
MLNNQHTYTKYIDVQDGKLWYKVIGCQQKIPILFITGGPSYSHDYLLPLSSLSSDFPVIFYDQLASGKFSVNHNSKRKWDLRWFLIELQSLLDTLEFTKINIFAHSWGAILAVELALSNPSRVNSLILASPLLSSDKWVEDAWAFRRTLDYKIQERMIDYELIGNINSINYRSLILECCKKCICRLDPWPKELVVTAEGINEEISKVVLGINMFWITGDTSNYECQNHLGMITCPTLLTVGYYDVVTINTAKWYQSLIPNASLEVFGNSSHLPHLEEPEGYLITLRDFLSSTY